jgi:hypothetical protein
MTGTDPAELVLSGAIELPRVLRASASESNVSANSIPPAQRLYLSRNPVLAREGLNSATLARASL